MLADTYNLCRDSSLMPVVWKYFKRQKKYFDESISIYFISVFFINLIWSKYNFIKIYFYQNIASQIFFVWRGPKKFNFDRQEVTLKFVGEWVDSILPVWYPVLETKNAEEIHFWGRISLFYFISQIISIFILHLFIIQNCRKTFNQINVPLNILISFFSLEWLVRFWNIFSIIVMLRW